MWRIAVLHSLALAGTLAAGTISIVPSTTTVAPGQVFALGVDVAGISDLYAFQFDLAFNPALLAAVNVTEGALFSSTGVAFSPGFIDNTTGVVSFVADSLSGAGPGIAGPGELASILFTALAAGAGAVDLANVILLDSNLGDIAATASGATITVSTSTAVPEPRTLVLLASALACFGVLRSRRVKPCWAASKCHLLALYMVWISADERARL